MFADLPPSHYRLAQSSKTLLVVVSIWLVLFAASGIEEDTIHADEGKFMEKPRSMERGGAVIEVDETEKMEVEFRILASDTIRRFLSAVFPSQHGSHNCANAEWNRYLTKNGTVDITMLNSELVLDRTWLTHVCNSTALDWLEMPRRTQSIGRHVSFAYAASVASFDEQRRETHVLVMPFTIIAKMNIRGNEIQSAQLTYPPKYEGFASPQYIPKEDISIQPDKAKRLVSKVMRTLYQRNVPLFGHLLTKNSTFEEVGETSHKIKTLNDNDHEKDRVAESFLPLSTTSNGNGVTVSGYFGDSIIDPITGNVCAVIWPYTFFFMMNEDISKVEDIHAKLDVVAWSWHFRKTCHYDYLNI
mmetsp:Transcript_41990/g.68169  ORF Transcript_41990/g.68169 Transcript_41990/m.68169 type:complete len:358 (-) Transcript_41990:5-1078(-)